MGLIAKFKEMFLEDDEMDKTRDYTKQIKLEQDVKEKEEAVEATLTERELYKSPSTFPFPVIFEEEDLKPSPEEKKHYSFESNKFNKPKEKEPLEHKFVASPIISPVYGILNKDYNKDEITNKSDHPDYESKRNYGNIDIDVVRQKAFGTLEEDLEITILEDRGFIYGEVEEEVKVDPIAEEMGLSEQPAEEVTIEEAFENYSDYGVTYDGSARAPEEPMQKTEVLEEDLFELINSMYKEEEEEEK